ncbi:MAG: 2OG-Fe(II) oxygenase family protein [Pseudomonadota bacterium]
MSLLNPEIDSGFDLNGAAAVFQAHGHVRLAGVMKPERASAIADASKAIDRWSFSYGAAEGVGRIDPQQIQTWPDEQRAAFNHALVTSARKGKGFAYFSRQMTSPDAFGPLPPPVAAMANDLMSSDVLAFLGKLAGLSGVSKVDAHLTQFRPGHYLTRHIDSLHANNRKLAFVWGLTKDWHPDWGGLLQFYDRSGTPKLAFAPGFNTLDIFSVEQIHAVTYVTPFATGPRQAVSGWYME